MQAIIPENIENVLKEILNNSGGKGKSVLFPLFFIVSE